MDVPTVCIRRIPNAGLSIVRPDALEGVIAVADPVSLRHREHRSAADHALLRSESVLRQGYRGDRLNGRLRILAEQNCVLKVVCTR